MPDSIHWNLCTGLMYIVGLHLYVVHRMLSDIYNVISWHSRTLTKYKWLGRLFEGCVLNQLRHRRSIIVSMQWLMPSTEGAGCVFVALCHYVSEIFAGSMTKFWNTLAMVPLLVGISMRNNASDAKGMRIFGLTSIQCIYLSNTVLSNCE